MYQRFPRWKVSTSISSSEGMTDRAFCTASQSCMSTGSLAQPGSSQIIRRTRLAR